MFRPHNGYTEMIIYYESKLKSAEKNHRLSLFLVGFQIEAFIGEEEKARHIEILLKTKSDINGAAVL